MTLTTTALGRGSTSEPNAAARTTSVAARAKASSGRGARAPMSFKALLLGAGAGAGASSAAVGGALVRPAALPVGRGDGAAAPAENLGEDEGAAKGSNGRADATLAREERARPRREDDLLDPSTRQIAQMAPPVSVGAVGPEGTPAAADVRARGSLEELLPAMVKKVAWAGDAKRGSVRMELGAGELAGSTVTVHADDGRVRVEIATAAGVDRDAWRQRILQRLEGRGIRVEQVDVT